MAYRQRGVTDESEDWMTDEGEDHTKKIKLGTTMEFRNLFLSLIFRLARVCPSLSFLASFKSVYRHEK